MAAEFAIARQYLSAQSRRLTAGSQDWNGSIADATRSLRFMETDRGWGSKHQLIGNQAYGTTGSRVYSSKEFARNLERWARARDEDLQLAQFQLIETIAAPVARAFQRRFIPFAESVIAQWPVLTGYSRREMFVSFEVKGNAARATINNAADYVFYIKWGRRESSRGPKTRQDWVNGTDVRSAVVEGQTVYYTPTYSRSDGRNPSGNVWAELARKPLRPLSLEIAAEIERGI